MDAGLQHFKCNYNRTNGIEADQLFKKAAEKFRECISHQPSLQDNITHIISRSWWFCGGVNMCSDRDLVAYYQMVQHYEALLSPQISDVLKTTTAVCLDYCTTFSESTLLQLLQKCRWFFPDVLTKQFASASFTQILPPSHTFSNIPYEFGTIRCNGKYQSREL